MDRTRVAEAIEEHRIHTVELGICDTVGSLRGKRIPADHFLESLDHGIAISTAVFVWDIRADVFDTPYSSWDNGYPDFHMVADLDTFRIVPWREGTAFVLCNAVDEEGHLIEVAPRHVLRTVVERVRGLGYEPIIGPELEFYLLDPVSREPSSGLVPCYSLHEESRFEPVMADIRVKLVVFGITLEASNAEYAPGQFEMNIRYGPALEAADATLMFRYAVKQIAAEHGLLATFMAKPFMDFSGSGMHIHQSLLDRSGRNLFWSGETRSPSQLGRHYAAGLLEHIGELAVLGCPTPNGYKRRTDYSFCPVNATWGVDNRTLAVRSIAANERSARLEQRDATADANPYLVIAAQLIAGTDGVERKLEPPDMTLGNAYTAADAPRLPVSLEEAVARLEESELARRALGGQFVDIYLAILKHELGLYQMAVTDWERARYLETS